MKTLEGAIYFSTEEPHMIGHLIVGEDHYEIVGLRRSKIKSDLSIRKIEQQADLFDGRSGDGTSERDLV